MKQLLIFIAALALCQVASGRDEETEKFWADKMLADNVARTDAHRFFNACEGMAYNVNISGKAALSESEIANALESRLRAARIFQDHYQYGTESVFNVYLTSLENAAMLSVGFEKHHFLDPYSKYQTGRILFGMETWKRGTLFQGGGLSGRILTELSKILDEFIANYLRVNSEDACAEYRIGEIEEAFYEAKRLGIEIPPDRERALQAELRNYEAKRLGIEIPPEPEAVPALELDDDIL